MKRTQVISDETPFPLLGKTKVIFNLIPYSAFDSGVSIDVTKLQDEIYSFNPIDSTVSGYRYNLDGVATCGSQEDNSVGAYAQVFRNGIIESVNSSIFRPIREQHEIPSIILERELILFLKLALITHTKITVSPPCVLLVSLVGVKDYQLAASRQLHLWRRSSYGIDRDTLTLPEVIIENYAISPETLLRPIFDGIWNSAGWPKSYSYSDEGEWGKGPNFVR